MKSSLNHKLLLILLSALFTVFTIHRGFSLQLFLYSPADGEVIKNNRPLISFSFGSEGVKRESLQVTLNQEDITSACTVTLSFLTYQPPEGLKDGENRIKIRFLNHRGEEKNVEWSFTVQSFNLIKSVTHNGEKELMETEVLTVTMEGIPGGRASFDIGSLKKGIPMEEVVSGRYQGSYRVETNDNGYKLPITGYLVSPDGNDDSLIADKKVTIDTKLFRVKILSPHQEQAVGQSFVVRGRSRPKVKIYISQGIGLNLGSDSFSSNAPSTGGLQTYTDENGFFEQNMGFPLSFVNMKMTVKVVAEDKNGNKSLPDTVMVYMKKGNEEDKGENPQKGDNENK